jgi:hypothetical protein
MIDVLFNGVGWTDIALTLGLIDIAAREFSKESQEPRGLKKLGLTGRTG